METASASDCRSMVIPVMADQPHRVFATAELAAILERSALRLTRPPDRALFDAMRKPVARGWVVRVGRGRYRFGTMPSTTLRRVRRWRRAFELGLDGPQRSSYSNWRPMT